MKLSLKTAENTIDILQLQSGMRLIEKQMCDVIDQLDDVVTESELAEMMNGFAGKDNGWLMYNTKYCSADVAYTKIYNLAKKTIFVVDNYIRLRTLVLLKNAPSGVEVTLFSDNVGNNKLHAVEYNVFCKEYPEISITLKKQVVHIMIGL